MLTALRSTFLLLLNNTTMLYYINFHTSFINGEQIKIARLLKPFEFGNGGRISHENLVMLEFKYLQNKKW